MWWTYLSTIKQHGSTNPYPKWGIKDVAMETSNLLMEGKFSLTFQMEGARNFTPFTNNTEGLKRSTNNNIRTF
jgi:hypothetical protein